MFQLSPKTDLAKPRFVHERQKPDRPKTSPPAIFIKENPFYIFDKSALAVPDRF
jgi:hypothetical protein